MCGIYAIISDTKLSENYFENFESETLKNRGPDNSNSVVLKTKNKWIGLYHSRLSINGSTLPQPIFNEEHSIYLIVNGEIFNYELLEMEMNYKTKYSDCEIIIPLYIKYRNNLSKMFERLNGQYSFVLIDLKYNKFLVSRDHIGVTSLYYGYNKTSLVFSSLLSPISSVNNVFQFKPRTYLYSDINKICLKPIEYVNLIQNLSFDNEMDIKKNINTLLTKSVELRLKNLENVEHGFLLSGGLDSSLIVSIARKLYPNKKIKTFSIGLNENSIDIIYAKKVAEYLGTEHYTFFIENNLTDSYSIQNNIENTIKIIESYDVTTVRASLPMYLLIKQIKEKFPNLKVLFSGELSDEIFCYLYGSKAPSSLEFQKETEKLVNNVYLFDCLRADKTSMSNGVEIRVPFSDLNFVQYCLNIHPDLKMFGNEKLEKHLLRQSFVGYLPDSILLRKKEQFSDGVSDINGVSMIDLLKKHTNNNELNYYKSFFVKQFKEKNVLLIKNWEPMWSDTKDPSGRIQEFWAKS